MKKLNKIFNYLLIFAVFFAFGINTSYAAPKSTTINREGVMGSAIGESYNWAKFKTTDGKTAYCMDVEKKWPEKTITMTYSSDADSGVRYILENGYPNKYIYDNGGDMDRFITQAAVWWYLAETGQTGALSKDFTTDGADPYKIRPLIQKLVNDAKNAKANETLSIKHVLGAESMSLSLDQKYFGSSVIKFYTTGTETYTIDASNAPEGTIFTDLDGNVKKTFKSGDSVLVKVPTDNVSSSMKFKITAKATMTSNKAAIYSPSDSSYQRVVALYPETEEVTDEATFAIAVAKPKVCVDYVIVGNVKPDASLTDPTPGKTCYEKGTKYTEEKELTTRQENCKFNGWYTSSDLTGKWTNGSELNKNMTLYGEWKCGSTIVVPNTAANIPLIILGSGLLIIAVGVGIILYRGKKLENK